MRSSESIANGLERLWTRYASHTRRLLSDRMLRELALRRRFSLAPVDVGRLSYEMPAGQVPKCDTCRNHCCQGYENVVSLRLRDLARLLDRGREDLITREKPRFPEALLRARPSLRAWTESTLWRALPVMRQIGAHRVCAAYRAGRCSLYPDWPTSCARFPYTLREPRSVFWGSRCEDPADHPDPIHAERLITAAVASWDRRIEDAILLTHARPELDALGLGRFLDDPQNPSWEGESP